MAGVSVSIGAGVVGARASARVERRALASRRVTASVNGASRATTAVGPAGRSAFLRGVGGPAGLGSAALPRRRASRAAPVAPSPTAADADAQRVQPPRAAEHEWSPCNRASITLAPRRA